MKTIQFNKKTSSQKSTSTSKASSSQNRAPSFTRINYILLAISVVIILIGYVVLYFDNQIWSITSLYIAPTLLMTGYMLVIYAILKRTPSQQEA